MSHFGRAGPPDISDTYSLLVLNISFRTSADDLYPLFEKYGKVVDVFIPRDRRTGDSRGFAFVRYKRADEAQRAVEHLDGRNVDGRDIMVQFAKYGPNAEVIHKGRVNQESFKQKAFRRSPQRSRYRDDSYRDRDYHRERDNYRDRDYHRDRECRRSLSRDRYGRYRGREKDSKPSSRGANRSYSRSRSSSPDYSHRHRRLRRSRTRSGSPSSRSESPERRQSPQKGSPVRSVSPNDRRSPPRSPISGKSDNNEG